MLANGAPTATTTTTSSNPATNHNISPESIRQLTFSNSTPSGSRAIDLRRGRRNLRRLCFRCFGCISPGRPMHKVWLSKSRFHGEELEQTTHPMGFKEHTPPAPSPFPILYSEHFRTPSDQPQSYYKTASLYRSLHSCLAVHILFSTH